jgi:hypothetical protein
LALLRSGSPRTQLAVSRRLSMRQIPDAGSSRAKMRQRDGPPAPDKQSFEEFTRRRSAHLVPSRKHEARNECAAGAQPRLQATRSKRETGPCPRSNRRAVAVRWKQRSSSRNAHNLDRSDICIFVLAPPNRGELLLPWRKYHSHSHRDALRSIYQLRRLELECTGNLGG